jgi:hypothetical protein
MPESRGAREVGKGAIIGCIVWLGGLGCSHPPPIDWDGPPARAAVPLSPAVVLTPGPRGQPAQESTPESKGAPKHERRQCTATMRFAFGGDSLVYAAWWTVRADSSALLRVAKSTDGGHRWDKTVTADERDRSVMGCSRPAPSIAYDADSGYLHLAYFLEPAEGSGIFYEHLMQGMFHAPVVIVYGERPVAAAVSAAGDTVVVAYEDPNRRTPQIMLAMSYTAGHLFDTRVPASGDDVDARAPVVRVNGRRVAVGWYQTGVGQSDDDSQPSVGAEPVIRQGEVTGGR